MAVSRRQFFARFGRKLVESVVPRGGSGPVARTTWLRPPGAVAEPEFLEKCTRCTDCFDACPRGSIRRLGDDFGAQRGTPAIIPAESPCYLCKRLPCISACSTGALVKTAVRDVRMGLVFLRSEACYRARGQPCDYCIEWCPLGVSAIAIGRSGLPVVDKAGCVGCGVCVYLCPAAALGVAVAGEGRQDEGGCA